MSKQIITFIYELENEEEFKGINPMIMRHNGLKAVGCAFYDSMAYAEALEKEVDPDRLQEIQKVCL